jgi:BASS family bile acid:Na+ symporter
VHEVLQEIDFIKLNFSAQGAYILNIAIGFIMFGVALELRFQDFINLLKQPKATLVGVLSQFVAMPLFTFALVLSIQSWISPTIAMGMILVAACPGGNVSNFISALAKGNIALSVSLTAVSSAGGILFTPLNFAFWGGLYLQVAGGNEQLLQPLQINIWEVLQTIVFILGIPLIVGMWIRHKYSDLTMKIIIPIKRLSLFLFLGIVVAIFTANFDLFVRYIPYIFFIVLVHNALAFAIGYNLAKLFKLTLNDRKTISIETGIQNSGLALALLFNPAVFPSDQPLGGMAFIAAWWGVWHIIAGISIATFWKNSSMN